MGIQSRCLFLRLFKISHVFFFSIGIILDYKTMMDWHLFKVSSVTFKGANGAILSNSPHWSLITSSYGMIDIEINIF